MYMAYTAEQPRALKHVGLIYVASVIAAFRALVRAEPAEPKSLDARARCVAAAALPLTELLAARGMIDTVPVMDWLWKGGAFAWSLRPCRDSHATLNAAATRFVHVMRAFTRSSVCVHVAGIVDALRMRR